jgi:hypothetical protein
MKEGNMFLNIATKLLLSLFANLNLNNYSTICRKASTPQMTKNRKRKPK